MRLFVVLLLFAQLLPKIKADHVIYDGNDSIFVFDGTDESYRRTAIYHYNVSTSSVTLAGEMPDIGSSGILSFDGFGSILYFGGGEEGTDVYKFHPDTGACYNLTTLPFNVEHNSIINYNDTHILIFGGRGHCKRILSFNLITYESKVHRKTRFNICKSLAVKEQNKTLIYRWGSSVKYLNLEDFSEERVAVDVFNINKYSSYVRANRSVYIIGAQDNTTMDSRKHGIIKLDLDAIKLSYVPVQGFLLSGMDYFQFAPAAVFVEKLNRIYLFGGTSVVNFNSLTFHKDIWYIDLNPKNQIYVSWNIWWSLLTATLIVMVGCLSCVIHKIRWGKRSKDETHPNQETIQIWKSPQSLQLICEKPIKRGFGTEVYKARHSLHHQLHFAIKKMKITQPSQHVQLDLGKILKEFEHLSDIYNSNVVRLWGCWIEDENGILVGEDQLKIQPSMESLSAPVYFLFLQMEVCDSTLKDWITEHEKLENKLEKDVKGIMRQIVNGLRAIHQKGIVHRNIKPSNIMYCENGNLWKVGGLRMSTKQTDTLGAELSNTGLSGMESHVKPASDYFKNDVFSLGLTFLEMICMCPSDASNQQMFQQIRTMKEELTKLKIEGFATITNPDIIKLISKMAAINPADRIDIFDSSIDALLSCNSENTLC